MPRNTDGRCERGCSDEMHFARAKDSLRAIPDAQFGVDMMIMRFDRADHDRQFLSNLRIGESLSKQPQDFLFLLGEGLVTEVG